MATPDITGGFDCEESKKSKAVEESLQKRYIQLSRVPVPPVEK
ncbi:MAG TPA: hypothetical protein VN684_06325 [Terriglobales bacterium]|nr:hypothetical protein [Terriglobales bacterium]